MKAAGIKAIKEELKNLDREELSELCLSLSKFKKENKELLTYLLFEADDENYFIKGIKEEIEIYSPNFRVSALTKILSAFPYDNILGYLPFTVTIHTYYNILF